MQKDDSYKEGTMPEETQAEKASKAKTEFLSSMSHEIRTPLNVIIGMCDIARRHIDDRERVSECLRKISIAGDHMTELINNILDISKIEQGKLLIREEEFHVDSFAEEIQLLLEPLAIEKSIVLSVSSKDVINKKCIGDYSHTMQVMINLATNAIKYTPQGGFVKIHIEEKENASPEMVTYRFLCQDNGIGMSDQFLEHIFEPFARADDSRVHNVSGAGLGMSIVKEIVDALAGTIKISSGKDAGTTIQVTLDFKAAAGEKTVADIEEFKRQQQRKIKDKRIVLLAEDQKDNREVAAAFLEDLGFEVNCAENGEQVVDLFIESEEGFYKAVLMDMEMPVMDGCQATLMIRGLNRADRDVPIIAMTANAFEDDKSRAKKAGMDDYLTKPLKLEKLAQILRTWMTESVAHR